MSDGFIDIHAFGLKKYENPTLLPTLKRDQLYFHTLLRWNTKNGAHGESSSLKLFYEKQRIVAIFAAQVRPVKEEKRGWFMQKRWNKL